MSAISEFHGHGGAKTRKQAQQIASRSRPMAHGNGWSKSDWSRTWTFFEGDWHEGNIGIFGPRTHAAWLGSSVFDGARTFEGVSPDLDLHFERVNLSAARLFLKPSVSLGNWVALAHEGIGRFDANAALYIRPM